MIKSLQFLLIFLLILAIGASQEVFTQQRLLQTIVTPSETETQIVQNLINSINDRRNSIKWLPSRQIATNLIGLYYNYSNIVTQGEKAYEEYYNLKKKCQGLKGELPIVGSWSQINEGVCLPFPVDPRAQQLFVQKAILANANLNLGLVQKAYDIMNAYAIDDKGQQAIYQDLVNFFTQKNKNDLKTKYTNQLNTIKNTVYNEEQNAALAKQLLDSTKQTQTGAANAVQTSTNNLADAKAPCANLDQLRSGLDYYILNARHFKNKINEKQAQLKKSQEDFEKSLPDVDAKTANINALIDQYAAYLSGLP